MGSQRKPRTFVEIDEEGVVRLRGWNSETTLESMNWCDKTVLKRNRRWTVKKLDVRKLSSVTNTSSCP